MFSSTNAYDVVIEFHYAEVRVLFLKKYIYRNPSVYFTFRTYREWELLAI